MSGRRFGVEQEHFVFRNDGLAPTDEDMELLYDQLEKIGWTERLRDDNGMTLKVTRTTASGEVAVKSDFCSHILEIVYSPHSSVGCFVFAWEEAMSAVREAIGLSSLRVVYGGVINQPPLRVHLRRSDTDVDGRRMALFLNRPRTGKPLFHELCMSCMCSTQVNLDIDPLTIISALPSYYAFEYLIPLAFGNSRCFLGRRGRCVRHLMYLDNWPADYPLLAVPQRIPVDAAEYERQRRGRDYSYIALREGRVEFRSGCSQDTLEDVLQMIGLRLLVHSAVQNRLLPRARDSRSCFAKACERDDPSALASVEDVQLLKLAAMDLEPCWVPVIESVLNRIDHQTGNRNRGPGSLGAPPTPREHAGPHLGGNSS